MKAFHFLSICVLFVTLNQAYAQDENPSKWHFTGYGGIGFGTVENDNQPNYNLNSNNGELLISRRINGQMSLATGLGWNELSGNGFNSDGNFFHERTQLRIPLLLSLDSEVSENLKIVGSFGLYGQSITKDEYQFLNEVQENNFNGWNLGAQLSFGFAIKLLDHVSAGISYHGQTDLSKFDSQNSASFSDKQKVIDMNSVGLLLLFDL